MEYSEEGVTEDFENCNVMRDATSRSSLRVLVVITVVRGAMRESRFRISNRIHVGGHEKALSLVGEEVSVGDAGVLIEGR